MNISKNNIYYGQLVNVKEPGGIACGCKVHFFNKKGVLVGRSYEWLPYSKIMMHDKGVVWTWVNWGKKKCKMDLKQFFYEILCKIITKLIKYTQSISD